VKHRCDYCGGRLGLIVHRYYRMRFCCSPHAAAYRDRLAEKTRAKIQRLSNRREPRWWNWRGEARAQEPSALENH
jgi:hypothetical protein